jgi:hypothetical protein
MWKLSVLVLVLMSQQLFAVTCETKREIYIENATTRVWKTTICPNHRLPFHSHQFARVLIPEGDGFLKVIYRSGKKNVLKLEKQTPIFLSYAQGKESHQDVNIGKQPIKVTVIEFRKVRVPSA